MAADRAPMGQRLEAVRQVLQKAQPMGLPMAEVARQVGVSPRLMSVMLANYRRAGHVHHVGPAGSVRWHLGGGACSAASPTTPVSPAPRQLVTPANASRLQAAVRRPGAPMEAAARSSPGAGGPRQSGQDASVPGGVVIIRCPAGRDMRYEVPDGFEGPFTQDWRRRRGEAHGG